MNAKESSELVRQEAKGLVLQQVDYRVHLRDLLSHIEVLQVYQNSEETNIEAVFTFPMPVRAVLLDLEVKIGKHRLKGVVVERHQGQEAYEDAVVDGDAAVLLEQVEEGLYTLNAGNLLAGETASISYRYAELFAWQEDGFRFFLPTTLAPRYGDPARAGLAPHQVPGVDLLTENRCRIEIEAHGLLAGANFDSPSHRIEVAPDAEVARIRLAEQTTWMDRDFVLNATCPAAEKTFAACEPDGDGAVLWASFCPIWHERADEKPRSVKIVVDCSGSMAGDSIAQARKALSQILDLLRPQDDFNLIRFGSQTRALFEGQVQASASHIRRAHQVLETMEADMGGTEIGPALQAAYASPALKEQVSDLLLITDGEIWNVDAVVEEAVRSGHRIFAVGVGSAVSEHFVRTLAGKTAGACELVSPNEGMADRIVRHFRRISTPRVRSAELSWPAEGVEQISGHLETVYCGETLHVFARCEQVVGDRVGLELSLGDGTPLSFQAAVQTAPWPSPSSCTLARLAAAQQLREQDLDEQAAVALAVRHQLMISYTAMLVVAEREEDEKPGALPRLRQVDHMLAAGWGGTGQVDMLLACQETSEVLFDREIKFDPFLDICMDTMDPEIAETAVDVHREGAFVSNLCRCLTSLIPVTHFEKLADLKLEEERVRWLGALVDEVHGEEEIVAVFVFLLIKELPVDSLDRQQERRLRRAYREIVRSGGWDEVVEKIERWIGRLDWGTSV